MKIIMKQLINLHDNLNYKDTLILLTFYIHEIKVITIQTYFIFSHNKLNSLKVAQVKDEMDDDKDDGCDVVLYGRCFV